MQKRDEKTSPYFYLLGIADRVPFSTCHWCHVMAHESFEDTQVAGILNENYICIKVDREERPDIDTVYMSVCQMLTGSGGWPMTIFMTPEQKPFYAGTYYPKHSHYHGMGLIELLRAITKEWKENREKLIDTSEVITGYLMQQETTNSGQLSQKLIRAGRDSFGQMYDEKWGGFGEAPKFPTPHNLLFLLRYGTIEEDDTATHMATHTLCQMYRGGIFDHIGGGFSRYSTDDQWLVPHFEKMLYDNALLIYTYLEALLATGDTFYADVAKKTMNYVLRELTHEKGGFFCGQDADSEGIEGKYYVFTPAEVRKVLGAVRGKEFCNQYDISTEGNFERKSIPNLIYSQSDDRSFMDYRIQNLLYQYRLSRTKLHLDDKVLTSWNGLMIAALAKASCLADGSVYLKAAKKAQDFVEQHLTDPEGRLYVRWRKGSADHKGQLDDYAFYSFGLMELYQSTFEVSYLSKAVHIVEMMKTFFWDEKDGGFYLYASDSEQLISRPKEVYDGAIPSGNSVAAYVIGRLARLTGDVKWQELWEQQLGFLVNRVSEYPFGYSFTLLAGMERLYPSQEIICTTPKQSVPKKLQALLKENTFFNTTVLIKTKENQEALAKVAVFTKEYPITSKDVYYLCKNNTCSLPMEFQELKNALVSV